MSKFFDALEQAEQERVRKENTAQPQIRKPPEDFEPPTQRLRRPGSSETAAAYERTPGDAVKKTAVAEKSARPKPRWEPVEAQAGRLDDHLVSLLDPASPDAEQYRTLCFALEQNSSLRVVAVTSPGGGDGKTLTAINLASTLSQTPENRVLLIDADLRHPSVAGQLGIDGLERPGLVDAIVNPELVLKDVEIALPTFNLSIVLTGQSFDSPYETLKSPRLQELIREARKNYDYIIVDTPPVVPVPDCRVISRWVEGFLVVVAAHQTPQKLLEEALNIIEPAQVAGLVFNGDDVPLSRYYQYSYASGRTGARNPGWSERMKKAAAFSRASVPLAHK